MTIKRYSLVPHTTAGPDMSAATAPTIFVTVANIADRALIKQSLPNGTATSNAVNYLTIADVVFDTDGDQIDFDTTALTGAQITAITNWLTPRYPAKATAFTNFVSANGGTITRKQLAMWVINILLNRADIDAQAAITKSDVN